ncbi:MAG: hypothetical protein GX536_09110 [Actinobacteria bacterium]|nr:hypothetical protein [Actinomycetota bacterium]
MSAENRGRREKTGAGLREGNVRHHRAGVFSAILSRGMFTDPPPFLMPAGVALRAGARIRPPPPVSSRPSGTESARQVLESAT